MGDIIKRDSILHKSFLCLASYPDDEVNAINRSEFVTPQWYMRSHITGESELRLKPQQIKKFSLDTLFYCFHYLPGDVLQALASQELLHRGWRYHTDLTMWLRPATAEDGLLPQMMAGGQKHFVSFDPLLWSQRLYHASLESSKFLASSDYTLSAARLTQLLSSPLLTGPPPPPRRAPGMSSPMSQR
jgi:hypothetical protein